MSDGRNEQQHGRDELDHSQAPQRESERIQSKTNNCRQRLDRSQNLAHNTNSRRDITQAAWKQSSPDLDQADDSSELTFGLIADTVQGNTEAQMACYQKVGALFQEGLVRMKTLTAMVKTLSPPQKNIDKIQELQNLLEAQCQEKNTKVQELQNLLEAQRQEKNIKITELQNSLNTQCLDRNIKVQELQDLLNAQGHEKEALEQDLVSLKRKVATLSRMPNQVSDAELKQEMDAIWQQVRSWVKTSFRQSKTVPACVEELPAMSESSLILLGDYWRLIAEMPKSDLIKVVCAIVGRELSRILGDFYFGIESDKSSGNIFHLADSSKGKSAISPSWSKSADRCKVGDPDYEEWRARTAGRFNSVYPPNLQRIIHERISTMCEDIDLLGQEVFGAGQDDTRMQHLFEILQMSVKLGHKCAAQHSRFCFTMPHINVQRGILLDPIQMEDISGAEKNEGSAKMVKLAVFPCLYKYDCSSDSQEVVI